jgi:hypothetical protein
MEANDLYAGLAGPSGATISCKTSLAPTLGTSQADL